MLPGLPLVHESDLWGQPSRWIYSTGARAVPGGAWRTVQFAQRNVFISSIVVWKYSRRGFVRSQTRASEGA